MSVVSVVFGDIKSGFKFVALIVGSLSFVTVICAIGVFLNYILIGAPDMAHSYFKSIMNLSHISLSPSVRSTVMTLNWTMLIGVLSWCLLSSITGYRRSLIERAQTNELRKAAGARLRRYAEWERERQNSGAAVTPRPRAGNE